MLFVNDLMELYKRYKSEGVDAREGIKKSLIDYGLEEIDEVTWKDIIEECSVLLGRTETEDFEVLHYGGALVAIKFNGVYLLEKESYLRLRESVKLLKKIQVNMRVEESSLFDYIAGVVEIPDFADAVVVINGRTIYPVKRSNKNPKVFYWRSEWGYTRVEEMIIDVFGAPVIVERGSSEPKLAYFWKREGIVFFKEDSLKLRSDMVLRA